MKQNNSAKKYLDKVLGSALYFKEGKFPNMPLYQEKDIEAAFNAGRESVIESASKLEWEEIGLYGDCGIYLDVCKADKPLANFSIRKWYSPKDIELLNNDFTIRGGFKSIEEAKYYAIKVYEERIKEALGL